MTQKRRKHQAVFYGGAPHGIAIRKVRKGAFDALNKGSGGSLQGVLNPFFVTPFGKINLMRWVCGVLLRCFGRSDCHQLGECLHDDCDPPKHHIQHG